MRNLILVLALISEAAMARVNAQIDIEIIERRHSWCRDHPWDCYHRDAYREWREYRDWDEWQSRRECRDREYNRWRHHYHHYHHHHHHHHR